MLRNICRRREDKLWVFHWIKTSTWVSNIFAHSLNIWLPPPTIIVWKRTKIGWIERISTHVKQLFLVFFVTFYHNSLVTYLSWIRKWPQSDHLISWADSTVWNFLLYCWGRYIDAILFWAKVPSAEHHFLYTETLLTASVIWGYGTLRVSCRTLHEWTMNNMQ